MVSFYMGSCLILGTSAKNVSLVSYGLVSAGTIREIVAILQFAYNRCLFGCIMMYHDVSKRQAFIFLACLVRNWLGRNCIPVLASHTHTHIYI